MISETPPSRSSAPSASIRRSGYGIFADGQWFPFDAKGSELAKALIEKTQKKDHIKVAVEGTKREGKIFVQKLTEAN